MKRRIWYWFLISWRGFWTNLLKRLFTTKKLKLAYKFAYNLFKSIVKKHSKELLKSAYILHYDTTIGYLVKNYFGVLLALLAKFLHKYAHTKISKILLQVKTCFLPVVVWFPTSFKHRRFPLFIAMVCWHKGTVVLTTRQQKAAKSCPLIFFKMSLKNVFQQEKPCSANSRYK